MWANLLHLQPCDLVHRLSRVVGRVETLYIIKLNKVLSKINFSLHAHIRYAWATISLFSVRRIRVFLGMERAPQFLRQFRHKNQGWNGPRECLHDKINFDPCNKKLWSMDKFVNARYARFTNSNPKLRLRLSLDWDFSDSFAPLTHRKNLPHSFSVFCYRGQK